MSKDMFGGMGSPLSMMLSGMGDDESSSLPQSSPNGVFAMSREERAAELRAIDACHEALTPLGVHARARVIRWVHSWARSEQPSNMTRGDGDAL